MKRTLAILARFLIALTASWCPQAFPQNTGTIPTDVYKCTEGGKAVYQDGLCATGPTKPLKTHDARGIEAPKGPAPEYVRPPMAPVAIIPYTPSKPLGYTPLTSGATSAPTPCRSTNGSPC